jgi:glycosyltransferase involved in cell wall biosynthesis
MKKYLKIREKKIEKNRIYIEAELYLEKNEVNSCTANIEYKSFFKEMFVTIIDSEKNESFFRATLVIFGEASDIDFQAAALNVTALSDDGASVTVRSPIRSKESMYSMLSLYYHLFRKALSFLLRGKWKLLLKKLEVYVRAKKSKKVDDLAEELLVLMRHVGISKLPFVIDHNLGGGANHYRSERVNDLLQIHDGYCLLTFVVFRASYQLQVVIRGQEYYYHVESPIDLLGLADKGIIHSVLYNNAVSFLSPEIIPQVLYELSTRNVSIVVAMHDYYPICPSHILLDWHGKYCDLPNLEYCAECLPKNQTGFSRLYTSSDIFKWRSLWAKALMASDEIICFSQSTISILVKAYGDEILKKIQYEPHTLDYLPAINIDCIKIKSENIHIGVLGEIGPHKGAYVIQSLAEYIKNRNLPIRISVIGSMGASCDNSIVSELGAYTRDDLVEKIKASGANVFIFPSIWPETFSYVTHELIALGLPVVTFDLGAQAEAVKKYEHGAISPSMEPSDIIETITRQFHKIYGFSAQ